MSMLEMTGQVVNVFVKPATQRDGEAIAAKSQVQLMGQMELPNGDFKLELVTLTTHSPELFEPLKQKTVSVPVGCFSPSKGQMIFYIPHGSKPRLAQ